MSRRGDGALTSTKKIGRFFSSMAASRLGRRGPIHLSHLVTTRCDCRCPTCIWRDNRAEELNTEEIEALYREAGEAGFVANALWGGEPLLRGDLEDLCHASRGAGMITTVITNGYHLPERAEDLAPAIDSLIVSIDYPDAARHDTFRGKAGIFDRALAGIRAVRGANPSPKVIVNCLLHRGNEGDMGAMAELARSLGASLYVCPAHEGTMPETGTSNRDSLARPEGLREAARELLALKRTHRINNSRTYLRRFLLEGEAYNCSAPFVFLTVGAEGDVTNCLRKGNPYGNLRESGLGEILERWDREEVVRGARGCHSCINPNVVDTSYTWGLRPEPLLNALALFFSR